MVANSGTATTTRTRVLRAGLRNESEREVARTQFGSNRVRTTKYTWWDFVPKSFFGQFRRFANIYFLFQSVVMAIGQYTTLYPTPLNAWSLLAVLFFVMSVTMLMELRDDIFRARKDKEVNERLCTVLEWIRDRWVPKEIKSEDVVVGDILIVRNREAVAADLVLLTSSSSEGMCYVETAAIDGETNLKIKESNDDINEMIQEIDTSSSKSKNSELDLKNTLGQMRLGSFAAEFEVDLPNQYIHKFTGALRRTPVDAGEGGDGEIGYDGPGRYELSEKGSGGAGDDSGEGRFPFNESNFLLRDCVIRNTKWVIGVVTYTGGDTKVRGYAISSRILCASVRNLSCLCLTRWL